MKHLLIAITLAVVVAPHAADAQQRWTMVRSETLIVIGDQSPRTLRDIAIRIEQFRDVVSGLFPAAGRAPGLPTVVYVFGTRAGMRSFLPITDGKPAAVGGLMSRDGEVNRIIMSTEGLEESSSIAFHEYTHLLIGNTGVDMPVWLNEGLSEYYSTYALMDGGRTADIGRAIGSHIAFLRTRWLPLNEMIGVQSSSELFHDSERRTLLYPQAWALVHYLMTEVPTGLAAINTYLSLAGEGRTGAAAFTQALGTTPEEFDKILRLYVRREIFRLRRYRFSEKVIAAAPSPARTLSGAEADAWLGDLKRTLRGPAEAESLIESAAARDAELAVAQLALGRLRIAQERTSDGFTALNRATQLAPDDYLTQLTSGISQMRHGADNETAGSLAALRRAVVLRPDSPDAQAFLALAARQSRATLPEARTAIEQAITLTPGRLQYRLWLAEILLQQGEVEPARPLLRAIAALKSEAAIAGAAAAHLERLEAFERRTDRRVAAPETNVAAASIADAAVATPAAAATTPTVGPAATAVPTDVRSRRDRSLSYQLRTVGAGEQRTFGRLTQVECRPGGEVRFHVTTGDKPLIAVAPQMTGVELTQYRDNTQSMLTCGERKPSDVVYLTWRAAQAPAGSAGVVIAVEFMPDDFAP